MATPAAIAGGITILSLAGLVLAIVMFLVTYSVDIGGPSRPGGRSDPASGIDIGPGRGTDTRGLPVTVSPRTGLADGQVVFVHSSAFAPQTAVGVAVCLREADTDAKGIDACDTIHGVRYATDMRAELLAAFAVPRVITVGGEAHDCAAAAERCLLVAASTEDYDRSGGQTISFAPDLGPADLTPAGPRPKTDLLPIRVRPSGPLAAGEKVEVTATGFWPGEPLLISFCTEGFMTDEAWEACSVDETEAAFSAVLWGRLDRVPDRADADGAFTTVVRAPHEVAPFPGRERVDCTATGRCGVVVASAADLKRSAFLLLPVE